MFFAVGKIIFPLYNRYWNAASSSLISTPVVSFLSLDGKSLHDVKHFPVDQHDMTFLLICTTNFDMKYFK